MNKKDNWTAALLFEYAENSHDSFLVATKIIYSCTKDRDPIIRADPKKRSILNLINFINYDMESAFAESYRIIETVLTREIGGVSLKGLGLSSQGESMTSDHANELSLRRFNNSPSRCNLIELNQTDDSVSATILPFKNT